MYISHKLFTLGLKFINTPTTIRSSATFVDLIKPIRGSGEDCLKKQLVRQRDMMLESLEGAKGKDKCFWMVNIYSTQ